MENRRQMHIKSKKDFKIESKIFGSLQLTRFNLKHLILPIIVRSTPLVWKYHPRPIFKKLKLSKAVDCESKLREQKKTLSASILPAVPIL